MKHEYQDVTAVNDFVTPLSVLITPLKFTKHMKVTKNTSEKINEDM